MRLMPGRAEQIVENMLNQASGGGFPCHKTTVSGDDGERETTDKSQHCAGALIFAEKQGAPNGMMKIAERCGMYDAKALMANKKNVESVFDDADEAIEHLTQGY